MSPRSEEFIEQARDRLAAAREGGDYQAVTPSEEEARRYVDGAADFLAAIEQMVGAEEQEG